MPLSLTRIAVFLPSSRSFCQHLVPSPLQKCNHFIGKHFQCIFASAWKRLPKAPSVSQSYRYFSLRLSVMFFIWIFQIVDLAVKHHFCASLFTHFCHIFLKLNPTFSSSFTICICKHIHTVSSPLAGVCRFVIPPIRHTPAFSYAHRPLPGNFPPLWILPLNFQFPIKNKKSKAR